MAQVDAVIAWPGGQLCVVGQLDLATSGLLDEAVGQYLTDSTSNLRIDLSLTTFLDSYGVRALVRATQACRQRLVRLEVLCMHGNTRVQRVLRLLGIPFTQTDHTDCDITAITGPEPTTE